MGGGEVGAKVGIKVGIEFGTRGKVGGKVGGEIGGSIQIERSIAVGITKRDIIDLPCLSVFLLFFSIFVFFEDTFDDIAQQFFLELPGIIDSLRGFLFVCFCYFTRRIG